MSGGDLLVRCAVRPDPDVAERLPDPADGEYVGKLLKTGLLFAVSAPALYRLFSATLRAVGVDHDRLIRKVSREFDDRDLLTRIRRQPSRSAARGRHPARADAGAGKWRMALLAMMVSRFDRYHPGRVIARRQVNEQLDGDVVSETSTTKGLVAVDATESAFCPQTMITKVGGPLLDAEQFGRRRVGRRETPRRPSTSRGRAGSPGRNSSRVSRS